MRIPLTAYEMTHTAFSDVLVLLQPLPEQVVFRPGLGELLGQGFVLPLQKGGLNGDLSFFGTTGVSTTFGGHIIFPSAFPVFFVFTLLRHHLLFTLPQETSRRPV